MTLTAAATAAAAVAAATSAVAIAAACCATLLPIVQTSGSQLATAEEQRLWYAVAV
jgi:hypothetical protein